MHTVQWPAAAANSAAPVPAVPTDAAPTPRRYRVAIIDDSDELQSMVDAWQELAAQASEPNPFYEPWMVRPALRAFDAEVKVRHLFVHSDGPKQDPLLCAYIPLVRSRWSRAAPVTVWRPWKHLHCFLCTPLMRAGQETESWRAIMRHMNGSLLELSLIQGGGPVWCGLRQSVENDGRVWHTADTHHRALMECGDDAEAYIRATLSTGNYKELRRQRRRLTELGDLTNRISQRNDDVDEWLDAFLELEQKGWKGEHGGALQNCPRQSTFVREICRAAHERNRLMMLRMSLDGNDVALKINFLAGDGSFAFKIAFDESYKRFSPGVQLELDNIRALHERDDVAWMDSCAGGEHLMIDRLWRERRTIHTARVALNRVGAIMIHCTPMMRRLRGVLPATTLS